MKCPACGHEWREPTNGRLESAESEADHRRYVPIARFAFAAEAGYFENELVSHLDITTRVLEQPQFDSTAGVWNTWFVLCVPEEHAEEAQTVLRRLIEESEAEEDDTTSEDREGLDVDAEDVSGFEAEAEPNTVFSELEERETGEDFKTASPSKIAAWT